MDLNILKNMAAKVCILLISSNKIITFFFHRNHANSDHQLSLDSKCGRKLS